MFRNPVTDLIVALVVVLLIFGPKRLPSLGRSLGHGIREFRDGITGKSNAEEDRPALNAAESNPMVTDHGARVEDAVPAAPAAPPAAPEQRESAEVGSTEQRA